MHQHSLTRAHSRPHLQRRQAVAHARHAACAGRPPCLPQRLPRPRRHHQHQPLRAVAVLGCKGLLARRGGAHGAAAASGQTAREGLLAPHVLCWRAPACVCAAPAALPRLACAVRSATASSGSGGCSTASASLPLVVASTVPASSATILSMPARGRARARARQGAGCVARGQWAAGLGRVRGSASRAPSGPKHGSSSSADAASRPAVRPGCSMSSRPVVQRVVRAPFTWVWGCECVGTHARTNAVRRGHAARQFIAKHAFQQVRHPVCGPRAGSCGQRTSVPRCGGAGRCAASSAARCRTSQPAAQPRQPRSVWWQGAAAAAGSSTERGGGGANAWTPSLPTLLCFCAGRGLPALHRPAPLVVRAQQQVRGWEGPGRGCARCMARKRPRCAPPSRARAGPGAAAAAAGGGRAQAAAAEVRACVGGRGRTITTRHPVVFLPAIHPAPPHHAAPSPPPRPCCPLRQHGRRMQRASRPRACPTRASWSTWTWGA